MLSARRIRLIGVTLVFILLVTILYSSRNDNQKVIKTAPSTDKLNSIIDSKNNDKIDAAINNEISKTNNQDGLPEEKENGKDAKVKDQSSNGDNGKIQNVNLVNDKLSVEKVGSDKDKGELTVKPFDASDEFILIRALGPMIVFSKTTCPFSKKIKLLLKEYQITPEPQIVELDKHEHGRELQDYLKEVTGRGTVPNVLIGSSKQSKGGYDDFAKLHQDGELLKALQDWGKNLIDVKKINAPSNF